LLHLLFIVQQVAAGMTHIHARGNMKRNLTVDNEMVCEVSYYDPSRVSVKLCDFSVAIPAVVDNSIENVIPAQCLPPESANRWQYSSDVWSYGVLLWELFSYCQVEFTATVVNECPELCPENVWAIILVTECMAEDHERPTFAQLKTKFTQ